MSVEAHSGYGIIMGQRVQPVKQELARDLRRRMTGAEVRLWQRLRANQLDGLHWRRQQLIDGFIADFYCHAPRLIVELDGGVHSSQSEYDTARDDTLASRGLLILRYPNAEIVSDTSGVLTQIRTECQARIRP